MVKGNNLKSPSKLFQSVCSQFLKILKTKLKAQIKQSHWERKHTAVTHREGRGGVVVSFAGIQHKWAQKGCDIQQGGTK